MVPTPHSVILVAKILSTGPFFNLVGELDFNSLLGL